MPVRNVNLWVLHPVLGEGHTSDCGEPWIIPPTDEVIIYEPMELPLREQGVNKIETARYQCVSAKIGGANETHLKSQILTGRSSRASIIQKYWGLRSRYSFVLKA